MRLKSSISRVTRVSFGERCSFDGGTAVPSSSGYSLGSCNWQLTIAGINLFLCFMLFEVFLLGRVIAVVGDSSLYNMRIPLPFDGSVTKNHDLLIWSGTGGHADIQKARNDLKSTVLSTLQAGGSMLFPIEVAGMFYDVLDIVQPVCQSLATQIYVVSKFGEACFATANILSEYFNESKRQRAYNAENPLSYIINFVKTAHQLPMPNSKCVVFAPEYQQVVPFFGMDPRNVVVICDSQVSDLKSLMNMAGKAQIKGIPLDFRASEKHMSKYFDPGYVSLSKSVEREISLKLNKESRVRKKIKEDALTGEGQFVLLSNTLFPVATKDNLKKGSSLASMVKKIQKSGIKLINVRTDDNQSELTFPTLPGILI